MFAFLSGVVDQVFSDRVSLDVSGVGYELLASTYTLNRLKGGEKAKLYAHMAVSQDAVALYGFSTTEERAMFRRLLGVTRIGPKVALSALSAYSPQSLATIIVQEDEKLLARVSGLGKKGAQRIILELKENIAKEQGETPQPPGLEGEAPAPGVRQEAVAALIALGYDTASSMHAVARVTDTDKVETMIMQALKQLAR